MYQVKSKLTCDTCTTNFVEIDEWMKVEDAGTFRKHVKKKALEEGWLFLSNRFMICPPCRRNGNPEKCKVEGCDQDFRTMGLCTMHYMRIRYNGSPLRNGSPDKIVQKKAAPTFCQTPGCMNQAKVKGMCARHYNLAWRRLNY